MVQNIRDGSKYNMAVGRFTYGGRRSGHVNISSYMSRHTLERVCLHKFRVTMGRKGPISVVASCGLVGNVRTTGDGSLYVAITEGR